MLMFFTIEKLQKQIEEIKNYTDKDVKKINKFKYIEEDIDGAHLPEFDDRKWNDFYIGNTWGGYDKVAWFRTKIKIPVDWQDEHIILRFHVGPRDGGGSTAETLLYVNGKPLQGLDVWHTEAWLPPEYIKNGEVHIALKSWSGVLDVPEERRFKLAEIATVHVETEKFYYLAKTILQSIQMLDENDLRRIRLLKVLNKAFLNINFLKPGSDQFYRSIQKALNELSVEMSELESREEIKPKVTAIGHSHIDMAWLWRLKHTREKASRTFSTILHYMRQYPEFRYLHSSPQLYKFLKEDYPEIFNQVKEKIASGEWEITGGMWIEPDTNIPSSESLIRQILFGKRFIRDEFGKETTLVWLPDVFGFSWALPQIMKKSGIKYFLTSKISWNQFNRFPYDTFYWRGIDGTKILTYFITTPEIFTDRYTYNGVLDPESVKGTWDGYRQKDVNDEVLMAFGWGDGGGGPTKEMIETARVMKNIPGMPKVEIGKAEDYFQRLEARLRDQSLPIWDGELYLEFHRGTYTTQGAMKRANRKTEYLYHNAEWLNSLAMVLSEGFIYPHQELNAGWEKLLLQQFHDILPGTSIRQVYEDSREEFKEIRSIGLGALETATATLIKHIQREAESIIVFNPTSFNRSEPIIIDMEDERTKEFIVVDDRGEKVCSQVVEEDDKEKLLIEVRNVPAYGYKAFKLVKGQKQNEKTMTITPNHLENDFYKIRLNNQGQIISLYDKRAQREVLSGTGNVFQAFEDKPMDFDAWDIDIYYQEKMKEIDHLIESKVVETGPIRGILFLKWAFSDSIIRQYITIYKNCPRIDFRTEVDWKEKQVLLKVAFPVKIRSTSATYDIQFGNIERPTHWNTSWDIARFEVPGHKWADLSEGNYGVSILNDCKYGFDIKENVIRLSLIKSPIHPDETADRHTHIFTYSLLPHKGTWRDAKTVEEAYSLNIPLIAKKVHANPEGNLPPEYQLVKVDADHVLIETVKKAEDDDALVIRVFDYKQYRNSDVSLIFGSEIKKAVECNLIEEDEQPVLFEKKRVRFSIAPYEIKTFKVWFK